MPIQPRFEETLKDFADESEQIGLVLPNRQIVWPPQKYKGLPIDTPEDRHKLLAILRQSATDLDFDETTFLANYHWATRAVLAGNVYGIEDESMVQEPATDDDVLVSGGVSQNGQQQH